jgi:ATP-dependent Clp protease, protease subunit
VPPDELFENRIILLNGEIDDDVANQITAELLLLTEKDPTAGITLYLNSSGGSMSAGMAIHDTMKLVAARVATWAVGMTAGAAQVLLSAGAPGERYALPQARIGLTRITSESAGLMTSERALVLARWRREIANLTAEATGQPLARVTADIERERQFSAYEAVEYGLVDQVVSGGDGAT